MAPKRKQQTTKAEPAPAAVEQEPVQPSTESIRVSSQRRAPRQLGKFASLLVHPITSKAFCLTTIAALYSPLSQLTLAPVYGSIPSAVYHRYGLIGSAMLSFLLRGTLPRWTERVLPLFAFWIPTIQLVLFSYSSALGNPLGPLVTELLTCYPLMTLSLYVATKVCDDLDLSFMNAPGLEEVVPSMVSYFLFITTERLFKDALPLWTNLSVFTSRVGLQLVVGVTYGLLLPKSLFWPAVPSIAITMTVNYHNPLQRTTAVLNNALALDHYTLLERYESNTGYLSVLEDQQKKFRVLRCDHSLLGGQWLDPPPQGVDRKVPEPIYAVFTMMEAIRLVTPPSNSGAVKEQKRALNIGLGVGTAPSAMIAHGINTTIVELDPVVHYFARTYFHLPKKHLFWIGDAVEFVGEKPASTPERDRYDYILHDAFTGGAVPTALFTIEFLTSLSNLLKSDGAIAINYAGDLGLHSASMVHKTIKTVFPNCRIFREEPEAKTEEAGDFTNLVYFCTHPDNAQKINFRKPVTADYLGSGARQQYLVPKHEVDGSKKFNGEVHVISRQGSSQSVMQNWQVQSALGHWRLMRKVIPDAIWEKW